MLKDFISPEERVLFKPYEIGRLIRQMMSDEKTKLNSLEDIEKVMIEHKRKHIENLYFLSTRL